MAAEDVFLVQKTEMYREYSLPFDWKKIGKRRKTATDSINSSKNWDFYLISPDGKKFRSNVEVSKYLQNHPKMNYEPSVTKVSTPSDLLVKKSLKKVNLNLPQNINLPPKTIPDESVQTISLEPKLEITYDQPIKNIKQENDCDALLVHNLVPKDEVEFEQTINHVFDNILNCLTADSIENYGQKHKRTSSENFSVAEGNSKKIRKNFTTDNKLSNNFHKIKTEKDPISVDDHEVKVKNDPKIDTDFDDSSIHLNESSVSCSMSNISNMSKNPSLPKITQVIGDYNEETHINICKDPLETNEQSCTLQKSQYILSKENSDQDPLPLNLTYHKCVLCDKKYASMSDVTKHLTIFHKIGPEFQKTFIKTGFFS